MKIEFKGLFSCYQLNQLAQYIKEHLTDITIMNEPIYVYDAKISKVSKHKILVEA